MVYSVTRAYTSAHLTIMISELYEQAQHNCTYALQYLHVIIKYLCAWITAPLLVQEGHAHKIFLPWQNIFWSSLRCRFRTRSCFLYWGDRCCTGSRATLFLVKSRVICFFVHRCFWFSGGPATTHIRRSGCGNPTFDPKRTWGQPYGAVHHGRVKAESRRSFTTLWRDRR